MHILADSSDTWKFDYTLTITLDDGTVLPPFNSNINGLAGIVLNQDNRNYYGICTEVRGRPRTDQAGHERVADRGDDRVQHARRRQELRHDAEHPHRQPDQRDREPGHLGRHRRRPGPDASRRLTTAKHVQARSICRWRRSSIYLRDMVLPVVYINIGGRRGPVDLRLPGDVVLRRSALLVDGVRRGAGSGSPQAHGRLQRPAVPDPVLPDGADHRRTGRHESARKDVSLAFVAQKLNELFNSRQVSGMHRIRSCKIRLFSSAGSSGTRTRRRYSDMQAITNDPPPPDGQPLDPAFRWGRPIRTRISELG